MPAYICVRCWKPIEKTLFLNGGVLTLFPPPFMLLGELTFLLVQFLCVMKQWLKFWGVCCACSPSCEKPFYIAVESCLLHALCNVVALGDKHSLINRASSHGIVFHSLCIQRWLGWGSWEAVCWHLYMLHHSHCYCLTLKWICVQATQKIIFNIVLI